MDIKTKFKVKEHVWYVPGSRGIPPEECTIEQAHIKVTPGFSVGIEDGVKVEQGIVEISYDLITVREVYKNIMREIITHVPENQLYHTQASARKGGNPKKNSIWIDL